MRKANTRNTGLAGGQRLVMFQLSGQIEVALAVDNRLNYLAAGTGTNGSGPDGSFLAADNPNCACTGYLLDSVDDLRQRLGCCECADSPKAETTVDVIMAHHIERRHLVWMGLSHRSDHGGDFRGIHYRFESYLVYRFQFALPTDHRPCSLQGQKRSGTCGPKRAFGVVSNHTGAGGMDGFGNLVHIRRRDKCYQLVPGPRRVVDIIADRLAIGEPYDIGERVIDTASGDIQRRMYRIDADARANKLINHSTFAVGGDLL